MNAVSLSSRARGSSGQVFFLLSENWNEIERKKAKHNDEKKTWMNFCGLNAKNRFAF